MHRNLINVNNTKITKRSAKHTIIQDDNQKVKKQKKLHSTITLEDILNKIIKKITKGKPTSARSLSKKFGFSGTGQMFERVLGRLNTSVDELKSLAKKLKKEKITQEDLPTYFNYVKGKRNINYYKIPIFNFLASIPRIRMSQMNFNTFSALYGKTILKMKKPTSTKIAGRCGVHPETFTRFMQTHVIQDVNGLINRLEEIKNEHSENKENNIPINIQSKIAQIEKTGSVENSINKKNDEETEIFFYYDPEFNLNKSDSSEENFLNKSESQLYKENYSSCGLFTFTKGQQQNNIENKDQNKLENDNFLEKEFGFDL